jgi:hypothetical protein
VTSQTRPEAKQQIGFLVGSDRRSIGGGFIFRYEIPDEKLE